MPKIDFSNEKIHQVMLFFPYTGLLLDVKIVF